MTALNKYQRLECFGLWRSSPGEQRREVVVAFGDASLVLSDPGKSVPLTHWSLPAVRRRSARGAMPAIFSPDAENGETLELEEQEMIDALDAVEASLNTARRRPVRRYLALGGGLVLIAVLFGALWFPDALMRHAARIVPPAKRAEIDRMILSDLERAGHAICNESPGAQTLEQFTARVLPGDGVRRVAVLEGSALSGALELPGGTILLGQSAIMGHDSPEIPAGHILAARLTAEHSDPLRTVLSEAGLRATLVLLTTGDLPREAVRGHGPAQVTAASPQPDPDALLARFRAAEIPSTPYAYALDPSGETTLRLIEADPYRGEPAPPTVLTDGEWVALQGVCDD